SVGTAGSASCHVDQNDRQTSLAERARKLRSSGNDVADRVHGRQTDNAFLQVNYDQSSGRIEVRDRHNFSLSVEACGPRAGLSLGRFSGRIIWLVSFESARSTSC